MEYTFSIGLRGYDRAAVDRLITRAEAAVASGTAEERAEVRTAILRGFAVALRGYDRQQVDHACAGLVERLAA